MDDREKKQKLADVARDIAQCAFCKEHTSGKVVVGEGSASAPLVFVGEAPGKEEAKTGRPFIGRSGKFLRSQMERNGIDPKDVYITSPVKYLPDTKTPTSSQIAHGATHLQKQIEIIMPKLIILMGATAAKALLTTPVSIVKQHGEVIYEKGRSYFLTYHPSAAIRFLPVRKLFEEDFTKLGQLIKTIR